MNTKATTHSRRQILAHAMGAAALPSLTRIAFAEDYPSHSVRLIVGFTPGSASDVVGRFFAKGASSALGQQVVVENKPGAGSAIAAKYAAQSAPDGYTLFLIALSTLTNQVINPRLGLDIVKEFAPVARLASGPYVLVVDPNIGVNSVGDLTAMAKADPGKVTFGSVGSGSLPDLCAELFAQRAAVQLTHVPYQGSPQVITDLVAGRINMAFENAIAVAGQVKAGKIKALATTATKRASVLPQVPTMVEAGMRDFDVSLWIGVLAPAGTPRPVVDKLAAAAHSAMHDSQTVETMGKEGFEPYDAGPDAFAGFVRSELTRWTEVARAAGLKA
jgi:tripartite-type tricarboxylate transporter receptor subunit TctC